MTVKDTRAGNGNPAVSVFSDAWNSRLLTSEYYAGIKLYLHFILVIESDFACVLHFMNCSDMMAHGVLGPGEGPGYSHQNCHS